MKSTQQIQKIDKKQYKLSFVCFFHFAHFERNWKIKYYSSCHIKYRNHKLKTENESEINSDKNVRILFFFFFRFVYRLRFIKVFWKLTANLKWRVICICCPCGPKRFIIFAKNTASNKNKKSKNKKMERRFLQRRVIFSDGYGWFNGCFV